MKLTKEQATAAIKTLKTIAEHKHEVNEWQGADYFHDCVLEAQKTLKELEVKFNPDFQ